VDGVLAAIGPRQSGSVTEIQVAGRGGVPGDASAAVLNITAVEARSSGYFTVFPCGAAQPNASSVNYAAGETIPNAVLTRLGDGGKVCIYSYGTTDLLVDVNGYFPTQ